MKFIRIILNCLPVGAFFFAFLYLWRLEVPLDVHIVHGGMTLLSLALLGIVFLIRSVTWRMLLKRFRIDVNLRFAFVSDSLTILMKYIPGKVWRPLGKADQIAQQGHSLQRCSMVAFLQQFLMILSGLTIGIAGILVFDYIALSKALAYGALILLFLFPILLFVRELSLPASVLGWIPAARRSLFQRRIPPIADVMLVCFMQWILLGTAYLCFIESIGFSVGMIPILLQPLANNIGILSVFAPGGLGVREGVTVTYLILAEIPLDQAMAIAVACRFWFFIVEIGFYALGWLLKVRLT
jgi:hypothetical protein